MLHTMASPLWDQDFTLVVTATVTYLFLYYAFIIVRWCWAGLGQSCPGVVTPARWQGGASRRRSVCAPHRPNHTAPCRLHRAISSALRQTPEYVTCACCTTRAVTVNPTSRSARVAVGCDSLTGPEQAMEAKPCRDLPD